jgi:SH3-like domain-containing protein
VPHLHFGIYHRRDGPIDPLPFVHAAPAAPAPLTADPEALDTWRRIDGPAIPLAASPGHRAAVGGELPRHTVVRVQAATGSWYRVRLPDGRAGFVPAATTRAVDVPLRSERRAVPSPIRDRPTPAAATLGHVEPGRPVLVLGRFNDYLLVRAATGGTGWLASEPADAPR